MFPIEVLINQAWYLPTRVSVLMRAGGVLWIPGIWDSCRWLNNLPDLRGGCQRAAPSGLGGISRVEQLLLEVQAFIFLPCSCDSLVSTITPSLRWEFCKPQLIQKALLHGHEERKRREWVRRKQMREGCWKKNVWNQRDSKRMDEQ